MKSTKRTEEKINSIVDEILNEENDFDATETCPEDCETPPKETSRQCKCAVENSSRFSLRVMEAMRSLQRDADQPSTSSAEDIVEYIRANYRSDGDLYAQVRTALRQVCFQGFAKELLNNEYHLVGPVISFKRQNDCSLDCEGRISTITDDLLRGQKSVNNHENHACHCKRFPRRNGLSRQYPRSLREESLTKTFISDRPEDSIEPRFHSTRISVNETNNADDRDDRKFDSEELQHLCGCKDTRDDHRRDATRTREIKQRDEYEDPIPGPSGVKPSRMPSPIPARNAKKARMEDRRAQRAEDDEETTTEEDLDCVICHPDAQISREQSRRRRPRDRVFIRDRVRRNGQRRENDEENEEDEIGERMEEEDEEKEDEGMEEEDEGVEEEDEDTEDSIYRDLKAQSPRRRSKARERELKRWIRRCRQECERRMRAR
ncbi:uncharacterized protein [Linepithema humile]|uniref:uncharacterized protein n=1 Tax=Linepithema humile TaxID=83485 RepID=UPI00351F5032